MNKLVPPLPYKDFTIKAKLKNRQVIQEKLAELNALLVGEDHQTDYYFETAKGKLKLRQGNIENLITHYERIVEDTVERTIVYRYDLNPTTEQIEELFVPTKNIGVVKKQRTIYTIQNIKIHIDKLPTDEEFIEIEAIDRKNEFSVDELKNQCLQLKSIFEIADIDLKPTGYLK
ncbi:MAG TPA: hypothetical protein DGG95_08950 [Cytophagales bacterium]|jgi:adenylate cyclase, class 2|nr:hypothetical protein [Cytophagales bacterium]